MKFECQHCGQHIEAGAEWAGLTAECPSCCGSITVPAEEAKPVDALPVLQLAVAAHAAPSAELSTGKSAVEYDVFLCYRRGKGAEIAQLIKERLENVGFRVFLDVEALREGDWLAALQRQISGCTDFIPIITEGFFDHCPESDDVVRRELAIAIAREKNIVPLLVAETPFPQDLPPSLQRISSYQGVPYSQAYVNESLTKLIGMMKANRFGIDRLATGEILPMVVVFAVAILHALMFGTTAGFGAGDITGFLIALVTAPFYAMLFDASLLGTLFGAATLFKVTPGQLLCGKDWLIFWAAFIPLITTLAIISSAGTGFLLSFVFKEHSNLISFACMIISLAVVVSSTRRILSEELWRVLPIGSKSDTKGKVHPS